MKDSYLANVKAFNGVLTKNTESKLIKWAIRYVIAISVLTFVWVIISIGIINGISMKKKHFFDMISTIRVSDVEEVLMSNKKL